jgi:hypothetical protein
VRKFFLALAVLSVVGACKNGTDPDDPNRVVTVTVTAPTTAIIVGGVVQLSASAITQGGTTVTNPTISWTSQSPNVATVSTAGLVTGVSVGTAIIEARVSGVTGQINISVAADACASAPVSLNLGEVRTFAGPSQVRCVRIAATASPSEFLVVAYNGSPTQDERRAVEIASTSQAPSSQISTLQQALAALEIERINESDAMHERIDALGREAIEQVMRQPRSAPASGGALKAVVSMPPNVGDTLTYRVPDLNAGKVPCRDFFTIQAVVKAVGSKAIAVQDVNAPAGGFTQTDFAGIVQEFDQTILATDTAYFGGPTDRNNDGVIVMLFTPEVNKLTPAGSSGFTAGFFFRADLFTKAEFQQAGQTCPTTNEQELFYVLVPDPTGQFNNVRTTVTVRQTSRGTIAHELQHMLNQGVRMFLPQGVQPESVWLDEGMAHFAEEAVGRATRSYSDFRELNFADATVNADDYNAYFRQNFGRFRLWQFRPDTSSPTSNRAATELGPRGAAWAILRYAIDRHSNNNARAFTRALVRGPQTGVDNLMARVGSGLAFDSFLGNWLITVFTDHQSVGGLQGTFNYVGWNLRSAMTQYNNGVFPLAVNPLTSSTSTLVISGSGAYFRLSKAPGGGTTTVAMQSAGGIPVDFTGARLTLVRTQ